MTSILEDTNVINDLDEVVLKVEGKNNVKQEERVKKEEEITKKEEKSAARISDDTEDKKPATVAKKDTMGEKQVVDGSAYEEKRVAKYFEVEGQTELTLYFGRVASYYASSGDDPDSWEVQYDDGGEGEFGLEELEECLELARENRHLDEVAPKGKKKKKSREKSTNNDNDDSSVEDVTDQVIRDRKKQMEENAIDISGSESDDGDESGDESESSDDDNDEDYESDADDLSYADDDSFDGYKKRKAKNSPGKWGKRACEPKEPPLEVVMEPKDIPAAPGKRDTEQDDTVENDNGFQEASMLSGNANQAVKNLIIKLLNTGFHENSNEHEAKRQ